MEHMQIKNIFYSYNPKSNKSELNYKNISEDELNNILNDMGDHYYKITTPTVSADFFIRYDHKIIIIKLHALRFDNKHIIVDSGYVYYPEKYKPGSILYERLQEPSTPQTPMEIVAICLARIVDVEKGDVRCVDGLI